MLKDNHFFNCVPYLSSVDSALHRQSLAPSTATASLSTPMLRSNKRSKFSHDRQDIEQNELVQHPVDGVDVGGTWLPDGVLLNIFSFCLDNNKLFDDRYYQKKAGVPILFRNIAFVSPDFLECVYRYIQRTPIHLAVPLYGFDEKNSLRRIAWACQNNLKLGYFGCKQAGRNAAVICKYILQSCDISELRACEMIFYSGLQNGRGGLDGRDVSESDAVQAGVPSAIFQRAATSSYIPLELQRFFAEHVPQRAPALKRMQLTFDMEALYSPVLTNLSHSLEELELSIVACYHNLHQTSDQKLDLQELTRSIEQLTKLKKLGLSTNFAASFQIHSTSLEEIDTTDCSEFFFVDKCVCPSLKKFACISLYEPEDYNDQMKNGVQPVIPFTEEELEDMTTEEEVEVEVEVGSRSFIGMSVPGTCIVKIRCEERKEDEDLYHD